MLNSKLYWPALNRGDDLHILVFLLFCTELLIKPIEDDDQRHNADFDYCEKNDDFYGILILDYTSQMYGNTATDKYLVQFLAKCHVLIGWWLRQWLWSHLWKSASLAVSAGAAVSRICQSGGSHLYQLLLHHQHNQLLHHQLHHGHQELQPEMTNLESHITSVRSRAEIRCSAVVL